MPGGLVTATRRGYAMAGSRQTTSEDNYTGQLLARLAARGARDTIVYGKRRISGREAHDLVLRYAGRSPTWAWTRATGWRCSV